LYPVQKVGEKTNLIDSVHIVRQAVVLTGKDILPVGNVLQIHEKLVEDFLFAAVDF
jgi:hypothetical protein